EVAGGAEGEDRARGRAGVEGGPAQADREVAGGRRGSVGQSEHLAADGGDRIVGDRSEVGGEPRDDRAVHGAPDGQGHVVAAGDPDDVLLDLQRLQGAVPPVLVALDLLDVQVGDIGGQVREPPGDVGVVAD